MCLRSNGDTWIMKEFYDLTIKELVNTDRMRNGLAMYTPGQVEELKANIMVSVLKLGIIMSPDVLGVVVNQMVEDLVLEEYRYICDLFNTIDYDGFDVFNVKDREAFEQTPTIKDTGKIAIGLPLDALKAVKRGREEKERNDS